MSSYREPEMLTMRAQVCFYCPAPSTGEVGVTMHFGILCCNNHEADAIRDIRAHLHRTNKVRLGQGPEFLPEFFAALPETFSVRRSSGAVEAGWRLSPSNYINPQFITKVGGEWYLPACTDGMSRLVPIRSFMEPELHLPGLTQAMMDRTIAILDAGVYVESVNQQQEMAVAPETPIPAGSGIVPMIIDGVACRVVM